LLNDGYSAITGIPGKTIKLIEKAADKK
jgi:hypothetical protein